MYPELKITADEFLSSNFIISGLDMTKFTAPELLRRKNPEILTGLPDNWLIHKRPTKISQFRMLFDKNTSDYEFDIIKQAIIVTMNTDADNILYNDINKKEIQYHCQKSIIKELMDLELT